MHKSPEIGEPGNLRNKTLVKRMVPREIGEVGRGQI